MGRSHGSLQALFEPTVMASGIIDQDHECGRNTPANVALWEKIAQEGILGKTYRETMKMGWNTVLQELTRDKGGLETNGKSMSVPDFSLGENRPISQEDVQDILFR